MNAPRLDSTVRPRSVSRWYGWRHLRWVFAAATVPLALWACNSHPLEQPKPAPEEQTDLVYEVNPARKLDLIFVVDNSNSMIEEQAKLRRNFPRFMEQLTSIKGGAPDMHIAVISSDVGSGPTMPAPECDRGGDRGAFRVLDACNLKPEQNGYFLKIDGSGKSNFGHLIPAGQTATQALPGVFECMANLGVMGCGYEHQLLSLYFSLFSDEHNKKDANGKPGRHEGFLRSDAYLGIVILSDEDDCSGKPDADFYQMPMPGQAGSLRCNTKGHVCNGQPVEAREFKANLNDCKPYVRPDSEPEQSRLINIDFFVNAIRSLKRSPDDRILVSSIIGWGKENKDAMGKVTSVEGEYGIESVQSQPGGPTQLDIIPICGRNAAGVKDPDGSAAPAIRLNAFTKGFRNNTIHSICQPDLSAAMTEIGGKLRLLLENTCITSPLVDTKTGDKVDPDCQVFDQVPLDDGTNRYREVAIVPCPEGGGDGSRDCWVLQGDPMCGSGYRTEVKRKKNGDGTDILPPAGTLQSIRCLTCPAGSDDPRCVRN